MPIEKKFKLIPYKVHMFCDCGGKFIEDPLISKGAEIFFGFPTIQRKYKHICDKCGKVELFDDQYPKIIYEQDIKCYK